MTELEGVWIREGFEGWFEWKATRDLHGTRLTTLVPDAEWGPMGFDLGVTFHGDEGGCSAQGFMPVTKSQHPTEALVTDD